MNPLVHLAESVVAAGAELFLGAECAGCGTAGISPCPSCRTCLAECRPRRVRRDGPTVLPPVWVVGSYADPLRGLVVAHKDGGAWQLARPLGAALALAVAALLPDPDWLLVPVPSQPAAVRERGYDHTAALASVAGRRVGLRFRRGLARQRGSPDQAGQDLWARLSAQHLTMRARPGVAGRTVIVVDDIVTTGATCTEAVRALRQVGAHIAGVAAVCETPRHATAGSGHRGFMSR